MHAIFIRTRRLRRTLLGGGRSRHISIRPTHGPMGPGGRVLRISLRVRRLLSGAGKLDGGRVLSYRLGRFHHIVSRGLGCGKGGVMFVRNGKRNMLHGRLLGRLGHTCGFYA